MRRTFGKLISQIAEKDARVHLIVGDIGFGIFDDFREKFPDRFLNIGICEQTMIGVAAGMALEGLKPWVYTITPFLIERPFEQIKLDINQQKTNVKLVGYADYPTLGPTHSASDEQRLMAIHENINCFYPRDGVEVGKSVLRAYEVVSPCFISLKSDPLLDKRITKD